MVLGNPSQIGSSICVNGAELAKWGPLMKRENVEVD
jgi:hypothetical protein